ncbi:hypothetical protein [Streptomyces sp. P9-A4]|uniref:hypothetical protein n=1 Tax=Streptomyces sp. P9-A4 TaxID=3072285 RepID=UPI003FCD1C26
MPLTVVSKTLRHSTPSTTANIYSHLTRQAAREAVDIIDQPLTGAEKAIRRTDHPLLSPLRQVEAHRLPSALDTSTYLRQDTSRRTSGRLLDQRRHGGPAGAGRGRPSQGTS